MNRVNNRLMTVTFISLLVACALSISSFLYLGQQVGKLNREKIQEQAVTTLAYCVESKRQFAAVNMRESKLVKADTKYLKALTRQPIPWKIKEAAIVYLKEELDAQKEYQHSVRIDALCEKPKNGVEGAFH